jgi:hypothetical protein
MSGVNPSIGNQNWWNNPVSETGNQPPPSTTPPSYTHQSRGWTHVNAVPIPPGEVAQQSTQQANAGKGTFGRMVATQQSTQTESSTAASGAAIPPQYANMDEWKNAVKNIISLKRQQYRAVYSNDEKIAIVNLFENSRMNKTQFAREIMGSSGGSTLNLFIADVSRLR